MKSLEILAACELIDGSSGAREFWTEVRLFDREPKTELTNNGFRLVFDEEGKWTFSVETGNTAYTRGTIFIERCCDHDRGFFCNVRSMANPFYQREARALWDAVVAQLVA